MRKYIIAIVVLLMFSVALLTGCAKIVPPSTGDETAEDAETVQDSVDGDFNDLDTLSEDLDINGDLAELDNATNNLNW